MGFSNKKSGFGHDHRLGLAREWLLGLGVDLQSDFQNMHDDASFRRYFRIRVDGESMVLMDAPPPGEDVRPFIEIDQRLRTANLHAPEIVYANPQKGFLLLEDLGDSLIRDVLDENNVNEYFPILFSILKNMALKVDSAGLPELDRAFLRSEMDYFPDWYLSSHRSAMPRDEFDSNWDEFCNCIIDSALEQPVGFVHRDFHSCNLLRTSSGGIAIIDFQGAARGPLSYDFISLVWDRYIRWSRQQLENWMEEFRQLLRVEVGASQWRRYCDLMALQRNIKVVGIFARLFYRDGKTGYLEMIPRFYDYVVTTLRLYPEFANMLKILEQAECEP
jgi:aminoglycoside/choline kinase family phosphotransferase